MRALPRRVWRHFFPKKPSPLFAALSGRTPEHDAIAVWGFLNSETGLGASARGYADIFRTLPLRTRCHAIPLRGHNNIVFDTDSIDAKSLYNLIVVTPPGLLRGDKYFPNSLMRDTYRIGYWAWELAKFPEPWKRAYDLVDEVWTCSQFAAGAIAQHTAKPVRVVPHYIEDWNHLSTRDAREKLKYIPADGFVFLTVFDFSSWVARKNPHGTIKAFIDAFGMEARDAYLIVKYHSAEGYALEEQDLLAAAKNHPNIIFISNVISNDEMCHLHDAIDCFVSLHRSEGFGLNIAQAMISGKPVITTAYSGNMDFTASNNSFLVDYELIPVQKGDYLCHEGQVWAEPHTKAASAFMKSLYQDRRLGAAKGAQARHDITEQLGAERIRTMVLDIISQYDGLRDVVSTGGSGPASEAFVPIGDFRLDGMMQ